MRRFFGRSDGEAKRGEAISDMSTQTVTPSLEPSATTTTVGTPSVPVPSPSPVVLNPPADPLARGLGVASLLVAIVALVFGAWKELVLERARLRVEIQAAVIASAGGTEEVIVVRATNVGRRDTYLQSLWLAFGRPLKWYGRLMPAGLRGKWFELGLMNPVPHPSNTAIPSPLVAGATAQLIYPLSLVRQRAAEHSFAKAFAMATATTARGHSAVIKIP